MCSSFRDDSSFPLLGRDSGTDLLLCRSCTESRLCLALVSLCLRLVCSWFSRVFSGQSAVSSGAHLLGIFEFIIIHYLWRLIETPLYGGFQSPTPHNSRNWQVFWGWEWLHAWSLPKCLDGSVNVALLLCVPCKQEFLTWYFSFFVMHVLDKLLLNKILYKMDT